MRQTLLLAFPHLQATPPQGKLPSFDVTSGPGSVTVLEGNDARVPSEASYETHVTFTGMSSFVEEGHLRFDTGGLRLTTIGQGIVEPSVEEGTLQGAVLWRAEGTGGLSGATGLIASNFLFQPEKGTATDCQVVRLFLP